MAEKIQRPSILVIIPPPIWALMFVLIAWQGGKAMGLEPIFRTSLAGWSVAALGLVIAGAGRLKFAQEKTEILPASAKNSALVTTGLFSFTRNPMYLGWLIVMIGLALVIGAAPAYAAALVFFLFVNFISIPYEEEKMERQFGDDYHAYKKRVRRWI